MMPDYKKSKWLLVIFSTFIVVAMVGCSHNAEGAKQMSNGVSDLAQLIGSDISTEHSHGTVVVSYCPDNTCESFSMPEAYPEEKLNDFVLLYLYYVSDYQSLATIRKNIQYAQIKKVLQKNLTHDQDKSDNAVKPVLKNLASTYSINMQFIRYDEKQKNTKKVDIKNRIDKAPIKPQS